MRGRFQKSIFCRNTDNQRWSPRGHILKSLALASKPQVLENCLSWARGQCYFFELLKFCWKMPETSRKICEDLFLFSSFRDRLKNFFEDLFFEIAGKFFLKILFFLENTCACVHGPWLAKNISVLGLGCFFVSLALASSLVSSTPPQVIMLYGRNA